MSISEFRAEIAGKPLGESHETRRYHEKKQKETNHEEHEGHEDWIF